MKTFYYSHAKSHMNRFGKITLFLFFSLIYFYCPAQVSSITSSNIPIFIIDPSGAEIPNDPKIPAAFKIVAAGGDGLYSYTIGGNNTYQYEGKIGIEIRGNTSVEWPKKSYGFETQDPLTSASIDVSLMGFPAESDWVLNACYGDKSFIREVISNFRSRPTTCSQAVKTSYYWCKVALAHK